MVRPPDRRAFLWTAAASLMVIEGCASEGVAPSARARSPARQGTSPLLTPWLTLTGGWRLDARQAAQPLPLGGSVAGPRINFIQPVGIAAQGDVLLIADAGARTLWRFERSRDAMSPFAPFTGAGVEQGGSVQLTADLSAWVALPFDGRVVQYDARGRRVREWRDEAVAARPVAVAVAPDRSEIYVADSATAHVVVFDPSGLALRRLSRNPVASLQSVGALAVGPRGLYVLDRLAQQVVVFGARGEVLEVVGENQLVQPRSLAVDQSGRVFVGDDADQVIKVFRGASLLGSAGGAGAGPARFGRIEALAVDGNLLYVADSLNARIHAMLVAPVSMERQEAGR